jgi:hypothetical protein
LKNLKEDRALSDKLANAANLDAAVQVVHDAGFNVSKEKLQTYLGALILIPWMSWQEVVKSGTTTIAFMKPESNLFTQLGSTVQINCISI